MDLSKDLKDMDLSESPSNYQRTITYQTPDITCLICLDILFNPVIASDGGMYCEDCVKHWSKTKRTSPRFPEDPRTLTFTESHFLTNIYRSMNPQGVLRFDDVCKMCCSEDNGATVTFTKRYLNLVLDIIDKENDYRLTDDQTLEHKIESFCKIFSYNHLMRQIIDLSALNWTGRNGWRLIHYVCRFGDINTIKYVIEKNVDLNVLTDRKNMPIHQMCDNLTSLESKDQLEIIKLLVEKGVDLETSSVDGFRPIHLLCGSSSSLNSKDRLEAIKLLVEKGVDLERQTKKQKKPIDLIHETDLNDFDKFSAIQMLMSNRTKSNPDHLMAHLMAHHITSNINVIGHFLRCSCSGAVALTLNKNVKKIMIGQMIHRMVVNLTVDSMIINDSKQTKLKPDNIACQLMLCITDEKINPRVSDDLMLHIIQTFILAMIPCTGIKDIESILSNIEYGLDRVSRSDLVPKLIELNIFPHVFRRIQSTPKYHG